MRVPYKSQLFYNFASNMRLVKRLDTFVLGKFFTLFAGTFCISLFAVVMQGFWKYINDLVGKGLPLHVLGEFFIYMSVQLVPMAMPLAVLLASLITFGNLGEKLELLSIKAAGISLFRTMQPLAICMLFMAVFSFYIENVVAPQAYYKFEQLVKSISSKSPDMEIPEGAFYSVSEDVSMNIYVKKKNPDTGMMYNVMIYELSEGIGKAKIVLADSGRIEPSADRKFMIFHLYHGEQFEPSSNDEFVPTGNETYARISFIEDNYLIDYDTGFNLSDDSELRSFAESKTMPVLAHAIDSMHRGCDSLGNANLRGMRNRVLGLHTINGTVNPYSPRAQFIVDSIKAASKNKKNKLPKDVVSSSDSIVSKNLVADAATDSSINVSGKVIVHAERKPSMQHPQIVKVSNQVNVVESPEEQRAYTAKERDKALASLNIDTLYKRQSILNKQSVMQRALQYSQNESEELVFESEFMKESERWMRRHEIQVWQRYTMALSCIIFFFVGAPLGAIIRKGGLGFPVVIAVIVFIFYYIINTGGMKLSREGSIPIWLGMSFSSVILTPLGAFLTVKANNDSVVFNKDAYTIFFRNLFGIRTKRHIVRKEVIVNDPDYNDLYTHLHQLTEEVREYRHTHRRLFQFQLLMLMVSSKKDQLLETINERLEYCVAELSNSKDREILMYLNEFPVLNLSPRFRNRIRRDCKAIAKADDLLIHRIDKLRDTQQE